MGFFSAIKKLWTKKEAESQEEAPSVSEQESKLKPAITQEPDLKQETTQETEKQVKAEPEAETEAKQEILEKQASETAPAMPQDTALAMPQETELEIKQEIAGKQAGAETTREITQETAVETVSEIQAGWQRDLTLALREAEPKLSVWLSIALAGMKEIGDPLWERIRFLLTALGATQQETDSFIHDFAAWLDRMEYSNLEDFRSELQYRLALALELEDEEDERNRLFLKLHAGLARTREQFGKSLNRLFAGHSDLSDDFWDDLEELFIMSDMGVDAATMLTKKLRDRAMSAGAKTPEDLRPLLAEELKAIFHTDRRIVAVNPPEIVLVIGVNGVGKTTTIAKLAYRARMQGKKVLLAAADTFRAAAVEQLEIWADRTGSGFHAKGEGADPAAVAWEAADIAVKEHYDILFVDTAGRLHTKSNLMDELRKIRDVLGKKHPGAPHRSMLIIDATTGQNALQQVKLFKETADINEIILTKLDGTAKGGIALAIALQYGIPITFVGLGEKMEDLRPFDGNDFARALLESNEETQEADQ